MEIRQRVEDGVVEIVLVVGELLFETRVFAEFLEDFGFIIGIHPIHTIEKLEVFFAPGGQLTKHAKISLLASGERFNQLEYIILLLHSGITIRPNTTVSRLNDEYLL